MKNILLIDDSPLILQVLERRVRENKLLRPYCARSLAEADDLINEVEFFAAVCDLILPDAPKGEAIDLLTSEGIPTVAITASLDSALRDEIIQRPIIDYIVKNSHDDMEHAVQIIETLSYCQHQRILIVDDSQTARRKMRQVFNFMLFDIVEASDAKEALQILKEDRSIRVVVLDQNMPRMTGAELARKIRIRFSERNLIILGVTSNSRERTRFTFLKSGANDYFTLPLVKEEVTAKMFTTMRLLEQHDAIDTYLHMLDHYVISSTTDVDGVITDVSEAFRLCSGYPKEELIGKTHAMLRHPSTPDEVFKSMWKTISQGEVWEGEIRNLSAQGETQWFKEFIEPLIDGDKEIIGYRSIKQNITDRKRIEAMSIRDDMTGLYNRRFFNKHFPEVVEEAINEGHKVSFAVCDVDYFKQYNDHYGHLKGDDALICIAKVMEQTIGNEGVVFRTGGEEFGVLLPEYGVKKAEGLLERLRTRIQALHMEHSYNTPSGVLTLSIGVCGGRMVEGMTMDTLYKCADEALYKAKGKTRNCVIVHKL